VTSTVEIADPVAGLGSWAGLGIWAWRIATGRGHGTLDRRRPQLWVAAWAAGSTVAAAAPLRAALEVSW